MELLDPWGLEGVARRREFAKETEMI